MVNCNQPLSVTPALVPCMDDYALASFLVPSNPRRPSLFFCACILIYGRPCHASVGLHFSFPPPECCYFLVLFRARQEGKAKPLKPPQLVCCLSCLMIRQVHSVLRGILKAIDADGSTDVSVTGERDKHAGFENVWRYIRKKTPSLAAKRTR